MEQCVARGGKSEKTVENFFSVMYTKIFCHDWRYNMPLSIFQNFWPRDTLHSEIQATKDENFVSAIQK